MHLDEFQQFTLFNMPFLPGAFEMIVKRVVKKGRRDLKLKLEMSTSLAD